MKDNKVDKIIYTYPEGYKTGKDNDGEIIILQKDDYTGEDIKDNTLVKGIVSNAKLMHGLNQATKPNKDKQEFDEKSYRTGLADQLNADSRKKNKETIDKSKNYFLQLKVAEDPSQQKSLYNRTGKQVGESSSYSYSGKCECRDLIWGNKLSCEERKKVIEVCCNIWGEAQKMERANMLMAVMHLETRATFSPSEDNGKGYVGLVQFHSSTADGLGTTYDALKKMTFIQQMDYVEKYLKQNKDKMTTLVDFYLQVVKPSAVGNGNNPNYIVFDEGISVPDGDGSKTSAEQRNKNITREPWVTKYGYASNPPFMKEEGEYTKRKKWVYTRQQYEERYGFHNGKTYIWEIEKAINAEHYQAGISQKYTGQCINEPKEDKKIEVVGNRAPWMYLAIDIGVEMKGCKEGVEPMYSNAKKYLRYCGNKFEPTDSDNGAWCAAFMNWTIGQSINPKTQKSYSHSRSASSLASIDSLLYKKIDKPVYGCIVVYKHINPKKWKGHTGFLYGMTKSGKYILLGGNQSDTIMFSSYGEYTSKSKLKKLYGFYLPADYEITENDIYINDDIVNNKYGLIITGEKGKTV